MGRKKFVYKEIPVGNRKSMQLLLRNRFRGDRFQAIYAHCEDGRVMMFLIDLHKSDALVQRYVVCKDGRLKLAPAHKQYCLRPILTSELRDGATVDDAQALAVEFLDGYCPDWREQQGNEGYVCCEEPFDLPAEIIDDYVYGFSMR